MPPPYFCGYEGGGTNTTCIVMDSSCRVLGRSAGSGSNHYLVGLPAVAALLADLARAALQHAGISLPPAGAPPVFAALGMCGSGFLEPAPQRALEALLRAEHPWLSSAYYIDNDSPGSIYTAAGAAGGCVIIAGTGSMAQLMGADGSVVNCGGNGHMYGDGA
jgi:N-acetylglucosamine kinase-like BadF-type ATPase